MTFTAAVGSVNISSQFGWCRLIGVVVVWVLRMLTLGIVVCCVM